MRLYILGVIVLLSTFVNAQDTLRLTVQTADSLFLQKNLLLLAETYQIQSVKAQEIQAGLWENPNINLELSAFNPSRGAVDIGRNGQKAISIQQMISTAGKRSKRIALAAEASKMSEFEFFDLMRNLKFQLREVFFESYFLNQTITLLNSQIASLTTLVNVYDHEYNRNNISLKEVLRLKALLFQLSNNRADILFEIEDNQNYLRNLLQESAPILPIVTSKDLLKYQLEGFTLQYLQDKALAGRTDLKVAESVAKQAELNLQLQRALATPNINLGATYDQNSNYVKNYVGISASVDIPLFNKNQGNIKGAKSQIDYYKTALISKTNAVLSGLQAVINKIKVADDAFKTAESQFAGQFSQLSKGVFENFQKHNITLLEFIDFIETYNDSIREYNRLQADRIKVYEELNFQVGEELFNQ